jgi:ketosteroid isomerase-like protein
MRWFLAVLALFCVAAGYGQAKIKEKNGSFFAKDKSKPIRRGIEEWYEKNTDAFRRKDLAAVMALRTPDFHTLTPDGQTNDFAFMQERTRGFLDRIEKWLEMRFDIGTIEVQGDLASAYVTQFTSRIQRLPDGTVAKVESKVIQRETWRKTADGWKLYKVDDIKDQGLFINGRRVGGQ